MPDNITVETVTIFIGVITLVVGVANSVITNRRTVKSHHLQIILSVSESFRDNWESGWSDILDQLSVDHITPHREQLPEELVRNIRFMLNWIDWLGAMKSSGALGKLDILTSSIGISLKRIINGGYTILEKDIEAFGDDYWSNLLLVANHLGVDVVKELDHSRTQK